MPAMPQVPCSRSLSATDRPRTIPAAATRSSVAVNRVCSLCGGPVNSSRQRPLACCQARNRGRRAIACDRCQSGPAEACSLRCWVFLSSQQCCRVSRFAAMKIKSAGNYFQHHVNKIRGSAPGAAPDPFHRKPAQKSEGGKSLWICSWTFRNPGFLSGISSQPRRCSSATSFCNPPDSND